MGQGQHRLCQTQIQDLSKKTVFTQKELTQWYKRFLEEYPSGYMKKKEFIKVYQNYYKHGNAEEFSEHVFRVFDQNNDGKIDFREFISSLSLTTRGSVDDKLRWAFAIYDVDGDGTVSLKEIVRIVKSVQSLARANGGQELSEEKIREIFSICDHNGDGLLTVDEFIRGSKRNPAFMQLLTECNG